MKFVIFCHSIESDWNHGNAHFIRGIVAELLAAGHCVDVLEPRDSWSRGNLMAEQGPEAIDAAHQAFPWMRALRYDPATVDLEMVTAGTDLVIVHEWNDPGLVRELGRLRDAMGYRILFHDTHHRAVTSPAEMSTYDLSGYDGVLAFGNVIRDIYLERSWTERAWTWHEAADTRVFHPLEGIPRSQDLVWIGNWGDGERTAELQEFLIEPAGALGISTTMYGVRYPPEALAALIRSGIRYGGWIANHDVPAAFAGAGVTIHIPRRPYVRALPGIPTIRPFEAMACGIPLISAPWEDREELFSPGQDFLVARNGDEMKRRLRDVLCDPALAAAIRDHALQTIRARHTCRHRMEELLAVCSELGLATAAGHGHG